jgi:ABC transport system ATP-binding/permease protein
MKTREQRLGKTILELDDVAVERGGKTLFSGLTLKLVEGERWGVVGPNGTGKTSLLAVLRGDLAPTRGAVVRGPHTKIATFDQHRADLDPEATLEETLAADNDHVFVDGRRMHVASWLERFLFQGSDRVRRVKTLSGGEQNRLILARLFLQGANCLLLDEPTNDLDVATLQVLESAVQDHEGVVLVVSHDRRFLDRVVTGILAFEDGVVIPVQGDWTNYERWAAQRLAPKAAAPVVEKAAPARAREKKKRSYKEQREYEEIEAAILAAEAKCSALQAELTSGEVFRTDPKRAAGLQPALDAANAEVERLYARWAELSELDPS